MKNTKETGLLSTQVSRRKLVKSSAIGSCIQCVDAPSNVVLTFNESANDPVMHFC